MLPHDATPRSRARDRLCFPFERHPEVLRHHCPPAVARTSPERRRVARDGERRWSPWNAPRSCVRAIPAPRLRLIITPPPPFQYGPAGRVVIRNSADLWQVTVLASPTNPKWETH